MEVIREISSITEKEKNGMGETGYATASRKKILKFLQDNCNRTVTAADIAAHLKAQDSEVNLTTIYRYLDKLTKEAAVMKYVAQKGSQAAYQYVETGNRCDEHLHCKCVRCGRIIHLECAFMKEISEHIQKDHGFMLQCKDSILYGVCRECLGDLS